MADATQWQAGNEEFLAAALYWLRLRLLRLIEPEESDAGTLTTVAEAMHALERQKPPPALVMLAQQLGLSRFEMVVMLLCAGMEFDTRIAGLCARAQNNPAQPYPTFALALALFDEPAWDVLSPRRPLRYWRLIEINQPAAQPLTTSALRADERILNYIKGLNYLDDQLVPLLSPLRIPNPQAVLPPSQQNMVGAVVERLRAAPSHAEMPIIQLVGPDTESKQLIAWHAAAALNLQVYQMPAELLPTHAPDLESLTRLWQRESLLLPVVLYLDAQEVEEGAPLHDGPASAMHRFLARCEGIFFLDTRDVRSRLGRHTVAVDIAKPTPGEQQGAWSEIIAEAMPASPARLAGQFNLSLSAIQEIAQEVMGEADERENPLHDRLWEGCLAHTRPRLDTLAQRIDAKATWRDIVLMSTELNLLRQIADQVRQRGVVYDEWGFRQRMNRGLGIMALFAGKSGTGKTMAAEVLANDLRLNLYRIDLSAVVSKYIGETEKNLRRLFDAAEDGGAILFFDEADALFGSRSQVKDSHDRYANIEINYLLQRMEAYKGLAILATNMKSSMDEAFTRRLRFIINFPVPDAADRKRIWMKIFPPETPTADLDYARLAKFDLAGGSIYNVALNAAFLAARLRTPITMPLMLNSIRSELLKTDRLIEDKDFEL